MLHISHSAHIGLPMPTHHCVYTSSTSEHCAEIKDRFWEVTLGIGRGN